MFGKNLKFTLQGLNGLFGHITKYCLRQTLFAKDKKYTFEVLKNVVQQILLAKQYLQHCQSNFKQFNTALHTNFKILAEIGCLCGLGQLII